MLFATTSSIGSAALVGTNKKVFFENRFAHNLQLHGGLEKISVLGNHFLSSFIASSLIKMARTSSVASCFKLLSVSGKSAKSLLHKSSVCSFSKLPICGGRVYKSLLLAFK